MEVVPLARSIADCRGALIADQVTQRLALANRSTATPQLPRKKAQSGWIEAVLRPLLPPLVDHMAEKRANEKEKQRLRPCR